MRIKKLIHGIIVDPPLKNSWQHWIVNAANQPRGVLCRLNYPGYALSLNLHISFFVLCDAHPVSMLKKSIYYGVVKCHVSQINCSVTENFRAFSIYMINEKRKRRTEHNKIFVIFLWDEINLNQLAAMLNLTRLSESEIRGFNSPDGKFYPVKTKLH